MHQSEKSNAGKFLEVYLFAICVELVGGIATSDREGIRIQIDQLRMNKVNDHAIKYI